MIASAQAFIGLAPAAIIIGAMKWLLPRTDREILRGYKTSRTIAGSMREAFYGPVGGLSKDLELLATDWNIALSDIQAETCLWHGDKDALCPVDLMKATTEQLPHAHLQVIPNEGHYSLPVRHVDRLLETMAQ
jgi:pimeloyl-ACP methyl ester carboxylesterase